MLFSFSPWLWVWLSWAYVVILTHFLYCFFAENSDLYTTTIQNIFIIRTAQCNMSNCQNSHWPVQGDKTYDKQNTHAFLCQTFFFKIYTIKETNWASSWDYGTYQIGDQRRLRWACTSGQSCQSLHCLHWWSMEIDEGSHQKLDI